MSKPHIALIGLGLIGSSLGHAFKKYGLTDHISGYARSPETRARACDWVLLMPFTTVPPVRQMGPMSCF